MRGDFLLPITVLLHCFDYRNPPLLQVHPYFIAEELLQQWSVRVPLAFGYLGYVLVFFQVIYELINEAFLPQERLAPHLCPDGLLPDPPVYELPVLLLRLSPLLAELAQHPVSGQARMGL